MAWGVAQVVEQQVGWKEGKKEGKKERKGGMEILTFCIIVFIFSFVISVA
jgi:Na+-driven multidrug efflux pump